MSNSLIINNQTVINANLDFIGRSVNLSGSITVGNTTVTSTAITTGTLTVQSLTFGSISSSGGGFNITGGGSFTGTVTAGAFSTTGALVAGATTFNSTVTLGTLYLQNNQINVGANTVLTTTGATIPSISSAGITNSGWYVGQNGIKIGNGIDVGLYGDGGNVAVRTYGNNSVLIQNQSGGVNMAIFNPGYANINTGLTITGSLAVTGNISLTGGQSLITNTSTNGGLRLINGGATNSGYIEFYSPANASRLGYIGFGTNGGTINMNGDAANFNFVGAYANPQVNGNGIWHAGNFTPGNYALASSLSSYATTSYVNGTFATATALNNVNAQFGNYAPTSNPTFNNNINVNGVMYSNGGYPGMVMTWPNVRQYAVQVREDGYWWVYDNSAGAGAFSVRSDGSIWCRQLGDINSRIEDRAQAWANDRSNNVYNNVANSGRFVYVGDKICDSQPGTGGFISPFGSHCVYTDFWSWRFACADGQVGSAPFAIRYRAFQLYVPSAGWVTCGAAS